VKTCDGTNYAWTCQRVRKRAVEVLRTEGLAGLWFKVLGETVYRRVVMVERCLDDPPIRVDPTLPITIDLLRETDVEEYVRFRPMANPAEVHRRLADGQRCFVARYEGRLVHGSWVATQRAWIEYLAIEIQLAVDEAYSYESFTAADVRGHGIAEVRSKHMQRVLRDAGCSRLVAVIVPENRAAVRAGHKAGFHPFGVMGYIKIGPWRKVFCRIDRGARPIGQLPDEA
jgi:GNAT superfamily N-acetyltransferase